MQKQEYNCYTVADELWEGFHIVTPQYCFQEQGRNQYVCTLQKKEFVFNLENEHETFFSQQKDMAPYHLVAVTMTQSYSNYKCAVPVEICIDKDALTPKNVHMSKGDYHTVIFPGSNN
jgi:hypothetical protein